MTPSRAERTENRVPARLHDAIGDHRPWVSGRPSWRTASRCCRLRAQRRSIHAVRLVRSDSHSRRREESPVNAARCQQRNSHDRPCSMTSVGERAWRGCLTTFRRKNSRPKSLIQKGAEAQETARTDILCAGCACGRRPFTRFDRRLHRGLVFLEKSA